MAIRYSTGLRNALLGGKKSLTASTISLNASGNVLADSGNGLKFLLPGDVIVVAGAAQSGNNRDWKVATVAPDGSQVTLDAAPTTESAGASITVALANSRSFKDLFRYGVMEWRTGEQPESADHAETGEKLLRITLNSGAFSPGNPLNGLEFEDEPTEGVLEKAAAQIWSGLGLANGSARNFRFYDNRYETGASTTAIRFDGSIGIAGANAKVGKTEVTAGRAQYVNSMKIVMPQEG
ncbi:MAG TPA: hypothetical protein PK250_12750 [Syntrophobacter fumaroxidans]|nr:hypothetical protein [Syntrophobacter fumaroxidans]